MQKKFFSIMAIAMAFGLGSANAAPVLPSVTDAGWTTDRYEPESWSNVGTYQGRDNVLGIGIGSSTDAANRPNGQQSTFYNTQGRQISVSGGAGDSIGASLWLDRSFADSDNGFVRTDLWGRAGGTEAETTYPISGFTNYGGDARFRVYDSDTPNGWVDVLTLSPDNLYGTWVDFEILATALGYEYFINDMLVYTDSTIGTAGGGFTRGFLQAYNFNDPALNVSGNAAYTAHWADEVSNVPEPGSLAIASLALVLLPAASRHAKAKHKEKLLKRFDR